MATGDTIFNDTFTDTNGVHLVDHTVDTGTGWTEILNLGSTTSDGEINTNRARGSPADSSAGIHYSADATYPSADYLISFNNTGPCASDNVKNIFARVDATAANAYYVETLASSTLYDARLRKRVASSHSNLITHNNGTLSGAIFPSGDAVYFQIIGSDLAVFSGNSNETKGEVAHLYISDGDLTSANKAGLGFGRYAGGTDDIATAVHVDNFKVVEVAASNDGWNSPTTTGEISNDLTNPTNAYADDGSNATSTTVTNKQDYGDFGLSIPVGATISGISIKWDGGVASSSVWSRYSLEVSQDNGSTWSSEKLIDFEANATKLIGRVDSLWGLTWSASDFTDDLFRVRVGYNAEQTTTAGLQLDHLTVKVYYDEAVASTFIPKVLIF